MNIEKRAQFPTIPPVEVKNDPSAAHNQTVAHKIAATFPKVYSEPMTRTDPNEIKTIPLRPGPLPPEFAKYPKFLWHATEDAKIVNSDEELEDALAAGYLTEKPSTDTTADMLREKIKVKEAELKQLKANLKAIEDK